MKAFLDSPQIKEKYVARLEKHYKLDEIIKGKYWEDGKGCAVGCTIHSDNHNRYESELGIPEWLAKLEDVLFEGMPNSNAKEFPLKFIKSIPVGFDDWQHLYHQLCLHILEKECKNTDHSLVKQAISDIKNLHRIEETDQKKWLEAESAARSATISARSARSAESATRSAESATRSAWSAARSATMSARSAESAWSAESAARSARSAWSVAESAESATESAKITVYKSIADKLLELLSKE